MEKTMKSKIKVMTVTALFTSAVLAGCSGGADLSNGAAEVPSARSQAVLETGDGSIAQCITSAVGTDFKEKTSVNLNIITHDGGAISAIASRAAEISEMEESPYSYKINQSVTPAADNATKALTAITTGGNVPDIIGLGSQFFPMLTAAAPDGLVNFTDLVATDRVKSRDSLSSVDGKLYGVESGYGLGAYFYNAKIFDEHGIDPTSLKTWDDLIAAGKEKAPGLALNGVRDGSDGFAFYLSQRGGSIFDADGNVTIDTPEAADVLNLMKRGIDEGVFELFAAGDWYAPPNFAAMQNNTVIGYANPDWFLAFFMKPNLQDQSGEWRTMTLPMFSEGGFQTGLGNGHSWIVPKDGNNVDAATLLIQCGQATSEAQVRMFIEAGYLPHNISAFNDPQVAAFADPFLGRQQVVKEVYSKVADDAPASYTTTYAAFASQILATEVSEALAGTKSIQQALSDAQAAVEAEMSK
jgi:multiple sugar transport system substrate-binding protein/arabinosaccharide transport system substrate-binding protein